MARCPDATMKSRLTDLAVELAGRKRVGVLDYAPPEPRPTIRDGWDAIADWCRIYPCLSVFIVGLMVVLIGSIAQPEKLSSALILMGVTICSGAVQWWLRRPPRW
jgi:hypothetical protein